MPFIRSHLKLLTLGASCIALGAGAGVIANAGAATSAPATAASGSTTHHSAARPRRLAARAVQGQVVIHTRSGFVTVNFERGYVQEVSGQQLTLREATKTATYKTVTLTIPVNAIVRDNGQKTTLSALAQGQRVVVVQAPNRTVVVARTPKTG